MDVDDDQPWCYCAFFHVSLRRWKSVEIAPTSEQDETRLGSIVNSSTYGGGGSLKKLQPVQEEPSWCGGATAGRCTS